jgi:curved DNA-binding protein
MPRDFYEVLGVSRSASAEEITRAYKKLARQHHPDRNPGDRQAESRFKEIQNAYDTLTDATKRSQYDQFGHEVPPMSGPGGGAGGFTFGGPGGAQIDPEQAQNIFNTFFSGGGGVRFEDLFSGAGGGQKTGKAKRSRRTAPPQNIEVEASIPFLTAAQGGAIALQVGDRTIEVKVPAGIDDGQKLRVSGEGPGGGDILVRVRIQPHAFFRREGKDITLEVPISLGESILGGKVEVPSIDGRRVEVKIRPGTSSGTKMRLPGFGVAGGDQYVVFKIVVPKNAPDERSKKLIEEFSKLNPVDARADVPWK